MGDHRGPAAAADGRAAHDRGIALTERQLLMWLEHELAPHVPSSNMLATFRIGAALDPTRFQRAFGSVVERSDALRTVFETIDGAPRQRAVLGLEGPTELVDLSGERDPEAAFASWSEARRQRAFRLDERAFDSALVKLGPREHVWHLCLHHLITDGWSFALVYERTMEAYVSGACPPLPAFARYVEHASRLRESAEHARSAAFWKHRLAESLEPVAFYGRHVARRSAYYERRSIRLGPQRTDALRRVAARDDRGRAVVSNASLAAALTALVFAFVHRISGNRRIGVGTPFVNRSSKAFRETVGAFIEVLPLRAEIDPDETFASLLEKTQRELVEVLPHARCCTANATKSRAFEVMLNFHTARFAPRLGPTRTELWTGTTGIRSGSPRVAEGLGSPEGERLVVTVDDFDRDGSLRIDLDFDDALFDAPMRAAAVDHFLRLLDACVEDPTRAIASVDLPQLAMSQPIDLHASPAPIGALGDEPGDEGDAPRSDRELQLAAVWRELLGVQHIPRNASFFELGGDSLLAVRLLGQIRRSFGVEVSARVLFERPTLAGFAESLSSSPGTGPALVPLHGHGVSPPLFFLCGIHIYHQLAARLGDEQPSYGIFLPVEEGLFGGGAEAVSRLSVSQMASDYLQVIRARQPHGPYRLAGISFGGILAFEVAQRLRALGEQVELLALLDALLPRAHRRSWRRWAQLHLAPLLRLDARPLRGAVRARLDVLRGRARSSAANEARSTEPSVADLREDLYRRAMEEYDPRVKPYSGSVVFFRAVDREHVGAKIVDSLGGWGSVVSGGIEAVSVPGGHLGILRAPGLDVVADTLRKHLHALEHASRARPSRSHVREHARTSTRSREHA